MLTYTMFVYNLECIHYAYNSYNVLRLDVFICKKWINMQPHASAHKDLRFERWVGRKWFFVRPGRMFFGGRETGPNPVKGGRDHTTMNQWKVLVYIRSYWLCVCVSGICWENSTRIEIVLRVYQSQPQSHLQWKFQQGWRILYMKPTPDLNLVSTEEGSPYPKHYDFWCEEFSSPICSSFHDWHHMLLSVPCIGQRLQKTVKQATKAWNGLRQFIFAMLSCFFETQLNTNHSTPSETNSRTAWKLIVARLLAFWDFSFQVPTFSFGDGTSTQNSAHVMKDFQVKPPATIWGLKVETSRYTQPK